MLTSAKEMINYQADVNSRLAQENRDWQERMANSAHQREIADLKKAGLNPVLSVTGGNGATTPSGATASASDGAGYASALASLQAAQINSATQLFMHTTPGANTLAGQVQYFSDLAGVPLDEVLQNLGAVLGFLDSSNVPSSTKGVSKLSNILRGAKRGRGTETIVSQFPKLVTDYNKALKNGNNRKANRISKQIDRLAYFYPDAWAQYSGKKLDHINRENDYFGKNWRRYQRNKRYD